MKIIRLGVIITPSQTTISSCDYYKYIIQQISTLPIHSIIIRTQYEPREAVFWGTPTYNTGYYTACVWGPSHRFHFISVEFLVLYQSGHCSIRVCWSLISLCYALRLALFRTSPLTKTGLVQVTVLKIIFQWHRRLQIPPPPPPLPPDLARIRRSKSM